MTLAQGEAGSEGPAADGLRMRARRSERPHAGVRCKALGRMQKMTCMVGSSVLSAAATGTTRLSEVQVSADALQTSAAPCMLLPNPCSTVIKIDKNLCQ